jgi:26S proteasome regulatory subunit N5
MSIPKQTEDFSDLVDQKIPEYRDAALDNGKFGEAIENLLALEKKTRHGGDALSTAKVLVAIVGVCHGCKEYNALNENIVLLSKRRGLLKEAVKKMVQKAMDLLDEIERDEKMKLIDTLLKITEGKIFVEKQRARLSLMLAHIRESEGKIAEAAHILQSVQVETFGAMKKKEKTEFILEQMRLCLAKKDFIRTQIISKKINPKILQTEGFEEIKIKFNQYMIQYYLDGRKQLQIAKCYNEIYQTKLSTSKEQSKWEESFKLLLLYTVLSEHDNEQSDFIHRLSLDKNLLKLPPWNNLIQLFLRNEIMEFNLIKNKFTDQLDSIKLSLPPSETLSQVWEDLQLRVTEHNIRIIAMYYGQITMKRLCELLDLERNEVEKHVSRLVVNGSIYARINRPESIVAFKKKETPSDILNSWSSDIDSLLSLVENTCHLIHRENMIHRVTTK